MSTQQDRTPLEVRVEKVLRGFATFSFAGLHSQLGMTTRGVVVAIAFGMLLGLGGFTFQYGEGFSYFSKDPASCVHCHIMQPQYDSWQKASHHTVATCVDCHLPHSFIPKWLAKGENGFWHSKGFTFQDFPEPIFIRERNQRVLHNNCLHCHSDLVQELLAGSTTDAKAINCVHCHRSVGHGETVGLGKFEAGNPVEAHQAGRNQ